MDPLNRQVTLASRPKGIPDLANFLLRETNVAKPKENEVLVKSLYLSVDPYMRERMNDPSPFGDPYSLYAPLTGDVVGEVMESNDVNFKPGDIVLGFLEWSDYSITEGKNLQKLDPALAPITTALGVLGMPGMTAYIGLLDIGQPKEGETVVVSAASGAVGMLVGQIAKIKGCRAVGIAGSDEKVKFLVEERGFDAAINYKKPGYEERLAKACPNGVDIYFDNVGGQIADNVIKLINFYSRIIICGQISMYNQEKTELGPRLSWPLLLKSSLAKGFFVGDNLERFPDGIRQMAQWIKEGKIKYRENIIEGLENSPKAFIGLLKGENIGKQIVKIASL